MSQAFALLLAERRSLRLYLSSIIPLPALSAYRLLPTALSQSLDQERDAEDAADAERREAAPCAAPLHLVEQRRRDAHPRAADGVAEREGAAVDVEARGVEPQLAVARDDLRGEGFVQLDEVDLVEPQLLSFEQAGDRGDGADAHHLRRDARELVIDDARQRLRAPARFAQGFLAEDDQRRRAVRDARRVARRHGAFLREDGRELAQRLDARLGARVLVARERD